jgi:hypothetical protein
VAWARLSIALFLGLSLLPSLTSPSKAPAGEADPSALRLVASSGVQTLLPPKWEFRPLPETGSYRNGIQASAEVLGMIPTDLRQPGLEAYWVDATEVGVPSDYFEIAARGPFLELLRAEPGCRTERVAVSPRHAPGDLSPWPGQYVAAVSGTCVSRTSQDDTRWASFVAAPGFGPARTLGIPRSGLYVVRASVPEGPEAERQLRLLMAHVSFGGTRVPDFLTAAGLPAKLP